MATGKFRELHSLFHRIIKPSVERFHFPVIHLEGQKKIILKCFTLPGLLFILIPTGGSLALTPRLFSAAVLRLIFQYSQNRRQQLRKAILCSLGRLPALFTSFRSEAAQTSMDTRRTGRNSASATESPADILDSMLRSLTEHNAVDMPQSDAAVKSWVKMRVRSLANESKLLPRPSIAETSLFDEAKLSIVIQ
jgi:hypothetical protein